jgi:hypothetical protein
MKTLIAALALATLAPLAANAAPVSAHDQLVAAINAAYHTSFPTAAQANTLQAPAASRSATFRGAQTAQNTSQTVHFSHYQPAPLYGAGEAG